HPGRGRCRLGHRPGSPVRRADLRGVDEPGSVPGPGAGGVAAGQLVAVPDGSGPGGGHRRAWLPVCASSRLLLSVGYALEGGLPVKRVIFVCVENSNRSQMAEAFARMHGAGKVEAHSAGSRPSGRINPKAVEAMKEVGYDLATHTSKGLDGFNG